MTRRGARRYIATLALVAGFATTAAQAQDVNGCTAANTVDRQGESPVTITFGGALGLNYSPRCVRVSVGTQIRLSGSFTSHPTIGGQQVNGILFDDPSSPFSPVQETGTLRVVTMTTPGGYGYYCDLHGNIGMIAAVFVGAAALPDPLFENGFE